MNRVVGSAVLVSKICMRTVSTTAVQRCSRPDLTKLKKKQMLFQVDNGVPVFLKGGPMDHVLYYATWALTIGGLILSGRAIYKLTKK